MTRFLELLSAYYRPVIEIGLLAAVFYYLLLLLRGTRGAAVFSGLVIALAVLGGLTQIFQLEVINWILSRVLTWLAIAVVVIFQPEIRRALAQLGSQQLFGSTRQRGELIDVLVDAAASLARQRHGALIAVEREVGFRGVAESGVPLEAHASAELLETIFHPTTPLHDGGVVLRGDRIIAAGCVFPLTQRANLSPTLGMRHRAALGLSEETDAVVIVVSEERGEISVAHRGQLTTGLDPAALRAWLVGTLMPPPQKTHWAREWLRRAVDTLMVPRPAEESGKSDDLRK
ncbi:MAG: diadenylate cyclase CdaA [Verrucomicrobiae bacterium]|nr:diadenylate cyclase CdaA [Verrucomicrobiae bacterium]